MLANRSVRQRSNSPLGLWLLLLTLFIVPLWLSYSASSQVAVADQSNVSAVLVDVPQKSPSSVQSQSEAQSEDLNASDDTSDRSKEAPARPDEGLPAAIPVRYDASKASDASDASSATRQGSDVYCVFLPLLTGGSGTSTQSQLPVPEPVEGELVEGGAGLNCITSDQPIESATILRSSPSNGEDGVAVTRETIIEFSDPIDPDSVTNGAISAQFGGNTLATRLHVSPDNRTVTLFYNEPLPASARVRVTIDGQQLLDANGNPVDVDGDGSAGGSTTIDFDTLSLTVIEGTSVCGRVFASELDTSDRGTSVNVPLQGVTITVDGMEDTLRTTTDSKGNFCLDPAPAGRFFVHIDGRTATNGVPEGTYYPFVGKAWESTIGQQTNVGTAHLPLVPEGTLQPVSQTEETTIHLAPTVLEEFPEFADVSITVPANSLYADDGTRGGSVGIAPVPPDRLPGQLPEELNFPVVITVQTDGATNFDQPAPVCFPNLPDPDTGETLTAGEKSALFSFNHDTGGWEIAGSMTVNEDGTLICADEGVGVRAPGWHGTQPGTGGSGGGNGPGCPGCGYPHLDFANCMLQTALGALPGVGCAYGLAFAALNDSGQNSLGDFWNAAVAGIGCLPGAGTVIGAGLGAATCSVVFSQIDLPAYESCIASTCQSDPPKKNILNFEYAMANNVFAEQVALWEAGDRLFDAVVGSPKWGDVEQSEHKILRAFYLKINESLADSSPEGLIITTSERQSLLQLPLPSTITTADVETLIDRMTLIANDNLPQAEKNVIDKAAKNLEQTTLELENRGWTTSLDALRRGPQEIGSVAVVDIIETPHFYKVTNLNTGTILRGQLGSGGTFSNQVLAPNTLYEVSYVDPSTLQTASTVFLSGENGSNTEIPKAVLAESDSPDTDGDGLTDEAEDIIGTNANNPDTDDDDITDGAEVQQGTNPLDGLAVATGIIGTVDTPGRALDVCALNDIAAVADSDAGVSVFNVFNGMNPSIIAQVDTPGTAQAVACAGDLIAVADGEAGLAIVDISDPPAARVIHQVALPAGAQEVESAGDLAYVASGDEVAIVDLASGAILGGRQYSGGSINDLAISGDFLYILSVNGTSPHTIHKIQVQEQLSSPVTSLSISDHPTFGRMHIFAGDELIYVGAADNNWTDQVPGIEIIRDSESGMNLIGPPSAITAFDVAVNGSGLALFTGADPGLVGSAKIGLLDVSDPTQTDNFLTSFDTPGAAAAVSIYNGLAYVADRQAGMQVINYLAYDSQGAPPTIALASNVAGSDVVEGSLVRVSADVSDDVQVRNVEFYLDGKRIAIDGTFPFEYRFPAPSLSTQSTFTVTARAKDTGGNSTQSNVLTVNVIPDTEPPTVAIVEPMAGEFFTRLDRGIPVTVNATDNVRVADLSFKVDGTPVSANRVSLNTYEVAMPATIGTYQISVVATDGAGLSAESTPISVEVIDFEIGDQLSAKIDFAADLDRYVFQAEVGQVLFFDWQSEANFDWRWQLLDSAGTVVFNRSLSSDPGTHTLELGGTYTMIIGNQNSDDTGTYQFQLLEVPPAQTFSIAIGDVVSDGVPQAGAGNIEEPGSLDRYTFEASAGQVLFLDWQSEFNSSWRWQLLDSTGTIIFNQSLFTDPGTHTLELGGTYTMIIGNQDSDDTGTYQLQLLEVPPAQTFSIAIGDVVSNGVPQAGAGNIEQPAALDIYTFSASAGQVVYFDLQSEGNGNWRWELVDSAGTRIFNQSLSSDAGGYTLELGGTYTMTIGSSNNDDIGTYQLKLWDASPDEFSITIGDVVSDGVPQAGAGNIETPGKLDIYTFEATAGQEVFFDWQAESSSSWRWKLEDSEGTVIFEQSVSNDPGTHILESGATYTMIIGNQDSDDTGTYQLQLLEVPPAQTFSIAIGDVVSNGVPQAGAGNIEEPGSLDIYTFSATAGQEVFFDWQAESNSSWRWKLEDSEGTVIFEQGVSNDPGTHILELGGTYTMIVGNQNSDETGTYQFELRGAGQSNTFQINIGDVVSDGVPAPGAGHIEEPGSLDIYTFSATAGQVVYFDLREGFNNDWRWTLSDSQGTVIFNQDFQNDPGSYELSLGGTYTMTIGNQNSDHTGTYEFQLLAFRQR